MNLAEFKKNVWIYSGKLTFIIIGIVYLLTISFISSMGLEESLIPTIFYTTIGFFFVFTTLWGTLVVSSSLISEVRNRTWIYQKMSSINAIDMSFGKMFGPTLYQWILGSIFLIICAILVPLQVQIEIKDAYNLIFQVLIGTVFIHAVSLLLSLLIIRRNKDSTDVGNIKSTPIILILFVASLISFNMLKIENPMLFSWYGFQLNMNLFNLLSLIAFTFWAVVGYYRTMREELQYDNKPNYWLAFNLFIVLFYSGLIYTGFEDPSISKMYKGLFAISFSILVAVTLFTLFLEPIDIMQYNRVQEKIKNKSWSAVYKEIPLWLISLFFSFVLCILLCISLVVQFGTSFEEGTFYFIFPLVVFLFLVKSLVVNLLFHLMQLKKPNLLWFFYLVLWYGLVPAFVTNTGMESIAKFFYPIDPIFSGIAVIVYLSLLLIAIKLVLRKSRII